jgi:hypothetical protein
MMHIMKQVSFQNWCLHGVCDDETDTTLVLFCVEALSHVSGYVNSHNKRYPPAVNPMLTHKKPSCLVKVRECCALSINWITGHIFFSETTN